MHGGELVEQLGIDKLQPWLKQLGTDHQGQYATNHQHGQAEQHVQSTNVFVIGCIHPAAPTGGRVAVVIVVVGGMV
jgi:hypothetical protein